MVHKVASLPLADTRADRRRADRAARSIDWRPTEPATLVWVEALDGGDPRKKVPHRDRLHDPSPPRFTGDAGGTAQDASTASPASTWGERGDLAAGPRLRPRPPLEPHVRVWISTNPAERRRSGAAQPQDRYQRPGLAGASGCCRAATAPSGSPATPSSCTARAPTPQGDRPFLDRFDLKTWKAERLFQSGETKLRNAWCPALRRRLAASHAHESPTEPPNYFVRTAGRAKRRP